MAEEKILLNIEFNNADITASVAAITEARKQIDLLLESNKKLEAQGMKNSKAYTDNSNAIKAANTEVEKNSKVVQANTQAVKANEDSIQGLKDANKALLKERNLISTATEEGRKKIEQLNAKYDENSKIIANNSTQVEKQRFNIGNYQSALDGVVPGLGKFTSGLQSATQGQKGLTGATEAFKATGIGLIIAAVGVALGAVVAYFKQFEPVLDFIEDKVTKVTAVFGSLLQNLDKIASIVGNVLTGNFAAAAAETASLGTELGKAADEAQKLLDATRELEDAELKFRVEAAGAANQMKAWVVESKRRGISIEESNALLQKASDLENKLTEEAVKNAQKRADIEEGKLVASRKAQLDAAGIARKAGQSQADFIDELVNSGIFSPEALDPLIAAYEKVQQEASAGLAFQEKIQNQQAAQDEKEAARLEKLAEQRKKRAEEEQKRLEDIAKKREELLLREETAANKLALARLAAEAKEIEGAQDKADKLIEAEQLKAEQLLANDKLTVSERELIQLESDQRINDLLTQSREGQIKEQEDALAIQLENYTAYVDGLINEKKRELLEGTISQEEYNQEISDLQIAANEVQLAIKEEFGVQDLALEGRITDAKIVLKQKEAEETARLERFKVDAVKNTLGQVASLFNKNSIAFKALASAQTLIQSFQSAQAVFTGMTSTIPGPVGVALGIAGSAAAIIAGLANVAKINSVQLPKLAEGGVIDIPGKRHSQGGERVSIGGRDVAEVEQGEKMVILKRGAKSSLLRNLSNINRMAGGVDFYGDRSPKTYLADGGFVSRSAGSQVSSFQNLSITEDLKKVKLVVNVNEISRMQGVVNKAAATSELS